MRRYGTLLGFVGVTLLFLIASTQGAEKRLALVVGNSAYSGNLQLPNPVHDATLMTQTLRTLGFEVMERTDVSYQEMKRAIQEFGDRIQQTGHETVSLFYYAGHAVELKGFNYLVPIKAGIHSANDIAIEAVEADWVLKAMEGAGSRLNIVILDACRNNPFQHDRSMQGRGLASMHAPRGSLIAYATAPGQAAVDGVNPQQKHSPYTAALAHTMQKPGLTILEVFQEVRKLVLQATRDAQTPWESTSLTDTFYFRAHPGNVSSESHQRQETPRPALPIHNDPPVTRKPPSPQEGNSGRLSPQHDARPVAPSPAENARRNCGNTLLDVSLGTWGCTQP